MGIRAAGLGISMTGLAAPDVGRIVFGGVGWAVYGFLTRERLRLDAEPVLVASACWAAAKL